jgi:hypothetical protein
MLLILTNISLSFCREYNDNKYWNCVIVSNFLVYYVKYQFKYYLNNCSCFKLKLSGI